MKNPLLVVADMEASKTFYCEVLGLHVTLDFGSNITLTGGLSLQTKESWAAFIETTHPQDISFGGNDAEIYFEEDSFDAFLAHLSKFPTLSYVHLAKEHPWGQRAVRFYNPDRHIIEVGENIKSVCQRFLDCGMTVEEVAKRMDVPTAFVTKCQH